METTPPAQVAREDLVSYVDELLEAGEGTDYGPNGLQVEGRATIRRLITGVSACHELFVRARELQADAILVHHGLFWDGTSAVLTGVHYRRVRELILGELNLLAYHLPLDRHPEFGNNAVAARAFGLTELEPFGVHRDLPIGFMGRFVPPVTAAELERRCRKIYRRAPLVFCTGPQQIETLGILSGGGQKQFHQAIAAGLDAYLTGEVTEWVMNLAREAGVHYLAAGHHATERLGVRALGEHLAERFGIAVEFIDIDNPA